MLRGQTEKYGRFTQRYGKQGGGTMARAAQSRRGRLLRFWQLRGGAGAEFAGFWVEEAAKGG